MQTNFLSQPGSSLLGSLRGAPKHLPEIPSATQMEEQGVNLAEMNKLLLQKVEELTIYQIEKDKEVETFIKTNKYLPDIPSATQMEEQGVNLAEMNKLLLQKVEELTLYVIDLEKENDLKEEARRKEQGEREKLEERLERLEKLLLSE